MSTETTVTELVTDIKARLDAQAAANSELAAKIPSDEKLAEVVRTQLADLIENEPDTVRKLTFGAASDVQLAGTKYGRAALTVADVEFLYDMQTSLRGKARAGEEAQGVHDGPTEDLAKVFRAVSAARYVDSATARAQDLAAIDRFFRNDPAGAAQIRAAMDTAESGYGSQLVGAQYVGELWAGAAAQSRVFGLINSFEMTDPTAYLPVEADIPELLFVSESTANNSSNYSTTKAGSNRVTTTAKKFVIHQMWSGEMEEDSIIPFIPFLRRQAQRSLAHYSDSLVLNGDTTNAGTGNINLDDADPADTKHYLAFDGIRHAGLVDNTANSADLAGPVTLAALSASRGRMVDATYLHDWGHPTSPDDLVRVADPDTADAISMLDEVVTVDKFGPGATVLTGQVARVLGSPLIASIACSKTEADGKVSTTGSNNTKGQVVTFHRGGFVAGWRRRVMLETERIPATDQTRLVYSLRLGFGRFSPTGAASGIEAADVIRDISL